MEQYKEYETNLLITTPRGAKNGKERMGSRTGFPYKYHMKSYTKYLTLLFLCLFLVFGSITALAAAPSNACGAKKDSKGNITAYLTWELTDGTLTISGQGDMYSYPLNEFTTIPWYSRRSEIKKIVIGSGCTTIGQSAFINCTKATELELEEGLVGIEAQAFKNCTRLKKVRIPDTTTYLMKSAFEKCTSLCEVSLGAQMTVLRDNEGRVIDDVDRSFGKGPFYGCTALVDLCVPENCGALLSSPSLFGTSASNITTLSGVFYRGTKADWVKMFTSKTPIAAVALADKIVCTDGTLDKENDPVAETINFRLFGNGHLVLKKGALTCLTTSYLANVISKIKTLTIPYNLTEVGENCTKNMTSLENVIFEGTEAEWNKITIADGNMPLTDAGKTFHVHSKTTTKVVSPTCTKKGYTVKICGVCGREASSHTSITKATNHPNRITTVEKEGNCVSEGTNHYECPDCGKSWNESTPIDADNHGFLNNCYEESTCTTRGYEGKRCAVCDKVVSITKYLPLKAHEWETAGTYLDGSTRQICSVCKNSELMLASPSVLSIFPVTDVRKLRVNVYGLNETIELSSSIDGGTSWTSLGTISAGKNYKEIPVTNGETYEFRVRYKKKYELEGKSKTEYSVYSKVFTYETAWATTITSITNTSTGQLVKWSAVPKSLGATDVSYTIVEDESQGKTPYMSIDVGNVTSMTYTLNNENGKKHAYAISVFYYDADGKICRSTSLTAAYYYLTRPTLTYYKNTSAGTIKLTWKRNSKASGYQVKYVTGTTTKTVTISGNSNTSKTLTKLTKGNTYKVYVRAYKTVSGKKYYSAWSSSKSVKVSK